MTPSLVPCFSAFVADEGYTFVCRYVEPLYTVSQKRPTLTCYHLDTHDPITTIFGRNVTKKAKNQMMLCIPTSSIYWFCTTLLAK